jgi:hypothetical protein
VLPKRKTKLEYWYHVSCKNHGQQIVFTPREIKYHFGGGEPSYPRVCVAPSVAECLAAIRHDIGSSNLYVYRTATQERAYYPKQEFVNSERAYRDFESLNLARVNNRFFAKVEDAHITNERWVLTPTRFVLMSVIKKARAYEIDAMLPNFQPGDPRGFDEQKNAIKILKKIKAYA